jgi:uncharacterized cupin superfamily protein
MPRTDIPVFPTGLELSAAPINPAWILDGAPHARNRILWTSTDKTGFCMLWDCTEGKFNWTYGLDELVHVIEGGVTVTGPDGIAKTLRAGDVALFPKGTVVHWHVENYVRKVAYCQKQLPEMIALPVRLLRKLKSFFMRPGAASRPSATDDAFDFGSELGIGIDFRSLTKGNPGAHLRQ